MPVKSNVPIRICGSKTRTGCKTCKRRHVKCDEGRPVCLRCQKANRECVYEAILELATTYAANEVRYKTTIPPHVDPYSSRDVSETNAIKTFSVLLGKQFSGAFSPDLWCKVIPRTAHHEPAIWHAVTAISMLDTNMRQNLEHSQQDTDNYAALTHYGKAVRELQLRLSVSQCILTQDLVLLSCVLFAIFECIQNRLQPALRHIKSGVKLLAQWSHDLPSQDDSQMYRGYLDRASLLPILQTMDSQALQIGSDDFVDQSLLQAATDRLSIPSSFHTADAAHGWLCYIFNRMSHWGQRIDMISASHQEKGETTVEEEILRKDLIQWDVAFESLRESSYVQPAIVLLLAERKVIQIIFDKEISGSSEMEWDKHVTSFDDALNLLETYMSLVAENNPAMNKTASLQPNMSRPSFTLSMDVVLPLYLISTRCRDSGIRRRALSRLSSCGRQEGLWNSTFCSIVAEQIVNLEEENALENGYIPAYARIFGLEIRSDRDSGGEIVYKRMVRDEDGQRPIETCVSKLPW